MLELWQAWRGGLGGGHLPFSGGAAEQPSNVMEGFRAMEAAAAKLKERKPHD